MEDDASAENDLSDEDLAALGMAMHEALGSDRIEGKQRAAIFRSFGKIFDAHGVSLSDFDSICPECGSPTDSIGDMFRGFEDAVDNYDEARERLAVEEREVVAHPDTGKVIELDTARRLDEWEEIDEVGERDTREYVLGPADDPDSVGAMATERWCTECDWSERLL